MNMKRILVLALASTALALQGCAATCEDACSAGFDCLKTVGYEVTMTVEQCAEECEKSTCTNKQAAIDCMSEIKCADAQSGTGELITCANHCPDLLTLQTGE
ncbi:MAG: hypothetical protein ACOX6T_24560 [Myxococcales bacterium]|jgi:hypothetical protein